MGDASIDSNSRATLTGVDSSDGKTPVKIYANATTHRLLVDTAANPGGSNTQVQFNDGGNFGGDADLTWDKTGNELHIAGDIVFAKGAIREIEVADQTTADTSGDDLQIYGGKGKGTSKGGFAYVSGGNEETNVAFPAFLNLAGAASSGLTPDDSQFHGSESVDGNGGGFTVNAGNANGSDHNGGIIILYPGAHSGSGNDGKVYITDPSTVVSAILDTSSLSSSDKTFTFNNATGGFVVANGNTTTTAPSTTATPVFTSYYGGNTKALGDPVAWIAVTIGATTYKLPLYT